MVASPSTSVPPQMGQGLSRFSCALIEPPRRIRTVYGNHVDALVRLVDGYDRVNGFSAFEDSQDQAIRERSMGIGVIFDDLAVDKRRFDHRAG
ncbi:MAG TPA: hypothetical protein VLS89_18800 [Candidatus Nanopelagicales bacterium]|nr:hypothetical protein [Candidatus Nanopelagicales bacterium]